MPDRVISVPQATQIAQRIKNKFDNVNGRLEEQAEGIDSLTTHQLEAEALLSIAREKGGS